MPVYDFKCGVCKTMKQNVVLPITHVEEDRPKCCDQIMGQHFTVPPQVHWVDPVIEPFRHVATPDRPVITTTRQNREYMKRNNLVDMNDVGPPTDEEHSKTLKEINESIEKITPKKELSDTMRNQGLLDIV